MAIRPLKNASRDLMQAFSEGMEEVARNITADLKYQGPYWSGQFYDLWVIEPGDVGILKNIPTAIRPVAKTPKQKPSYSAGKASGFCPALKRWIRATRSATEQTMRCMRWIYCHHQQVDDPPRSTRMDGSPVQITAPKYWFDTYMNSQAGKTVNASLVSVFRRYQ